MSHRLIDESYFPPPSQEPAGLELHKLHQCESIGLAQGCRIEAKTNTTVEAHLWLAGAGTYHAAHDTVNASPNSLLWIGPCTTYSMLESRARSAAIVLTWDADFAGARLGPLVQQLWRTSMLHRDLPSAHVQPLIDLASDVSEEPKNSRSWGMAYLLARMWQETCRPRLPKHD